MKNGWGGGTHSAETEVRNALFPNMGAVDNICLASLKKRNKRNQILPFSDVFWVLSWFRMRKEKGWEFLARLKAEKKIKIIYGHGIIILEGTP